MNVSPSGTDFQLLPIILSVSDHKKLYVHINSSRSDTIIVHCTLSIVIKL